MCIRLFSDNVGVTQAITNNYSKVESVRLCLYELHSLLTSLNCTVVAHYIPGAQNTVADTISRINAGDYY